MKTASLLLVVAWLAASRVALLAADEPTRNPEFDALIERQLEALSKLPQQENYTPRREALAPIKARGRAAVPKLREWVVDPDKSWQRDVAIEALGELGDVASEAVPDLLRLFPSPSDELNLELMDALGSIETGWQDDHVDALISLTETPHTDLQYRALYDLLMVEGADDKVLPTVVRLAGDKRCSNVVRRQALEGLGRFKPPSAEALQTLIDCLSDDHLRGSAIDGLAPLGSAAAPAIHQIFAVWDKLAPSEQRDTLDALAQIRAEPKTVIPFLRQRLAWASRLELSHVVRALGSYGNHAASVADEIARAMQGGELADSDDAAWALGHIGNPTELVNRQLRDTRQDGIPEARVAAALALLRLGLDGADSLAVLRKAIEYKTLPWATFATEAVDIPACRELLPDIEELLGTRRTDRIGALLALTELTDWLEAPPPAVIAIVRDVNEESHLRFLALTVLVDCGARAAEQFDTIAKFATDGDALDRVLALEGLGKIGNVRAEAETLIVTGLADYVASVRCAAAKATAELPAISPACRTALETASHDRNARVRRAAQAALEKHP